jgi:hypothetical protein
MLPEVDQFFAAIKPVVSAYRDHTFSYLAVRRDDRFLLLHGRRIVLNVLSPTLTSPNSFRIAERGT